jgi:predicted nucleic acid-binding Zn ribbon protein
MNTFQRVVDKLAKKSGIFSEIKVRLILEEWDRIIGEPLCSRTKPILLHEGVLYVLCEDPMWSQELRFHTKDLLKKLKEELDNIREVRSIRIIRRREEIVGKIYGQKY